jgi:mannose-1-phosphate guanylyltransferase
MSTVDDGLENFWAVVPAGGVGTRLWPMSRSKRPKFLLDIVGTGRSLLQAANDRLAPLCGNRFMVVTGMSHVDDVRHQLPGLAPENLLAEPAPRDSMAAIGLAAAVLERRNPDFIIGSFPADHVIPDVAPLHECIRQGYAAAKADLLSLIGLEPSRPTSALGYIQMGAGLGLYGAPQARRIEAFVEKPAEEIAKRFVDSGDYVWNAGMWIAKAGLLMDLLASLNPGLAHDLRTIAADQSTLPEVWQTIERTTIDHTIAEPLAGTPKVCVVPGKFDWEDIGDFGALLSYLRERYPNEQLHAVPSVDSQVIGVNSSGVVAVSSGRKVVVVGMDDVVIVDTEDALLVMRERDAQELKKVYSIVTDTHSELG